ncbi:hypothetical protein SAMN06893096_101283 [Geodermatophilus pulveris]|uniref:Primosomal protein n=1 Tax=Geodermatophilus pulveris TaxID=1564159 RepID=A0A239AWG8_9ACTN|nr:hypothetical protein [Geodermatophilus pulveris]SNS00055.1 hypothetical protein SAMN06893096_101283 [Geodermatophilus pulveris]
MARPSIVPIALTVDDRTGFTLWAPPWEEDGEEWQAFLGTSDDDGTAGSARVHLFPTPAALAAFCRTRTDHDLADHPVWPVVVGLDAADLTPDDDHRYDLDGVYDIAAEDPDRWAVEELAADIDIVTRLAECLDSGDDTGEDTGDDDESDDERADDARDDDDIELERRPGGAAGDGEFGALAELVARPEIGSLGLGVEAFLGRSGEDAWAGVGAALDDLWEDVIEELGAHLDWTGGGTVGLADYPPAGEADDDYEDEDEDAEDAAPAARPAAGATAAAAGVSTIARPGRLSAPESEVAKAAEFWEAVGILPVEIVVPEGAGVTLRCYVEDRARFLGRDGEVFLFPSPAELTRFCRGEEAHDLTDIASWPEVADTDTPPLPADQDRYDLTELTEVLAEVSGGAAGLVDHQVLAQQVEGVRDVAEYAGLIRVDELLRSDAPLGRAVARSERVPDTPLTAEDAATLRPAWNEVVTAVSGALVFRD